jgi:hypothetical protein
MTVLALRLEDRGVEDSTLKIWASGAVPIKNRHLPLKAYNLELWTRARG